MQTNKSNGQMTAQVSVSDQKKSGFDLSNNNLGTGKIGRIIPTRALHVMPGDTIKQDSKVAVQFEPLAVPILANMDVKQEHFYVPYNIVWKNWDKFISGGEKMDYKGVVPTTDMATIVNNIGTLFNEFFFNFTYTSDIINEGTDDEKTIWYYYMNNKVDFIINSALEEKIDYVGDQFKIKDLLAYQKEVLNVYRDFILNDNGNSFEVLRYNSAIDEARTELELDSMLERIGVKGSKYIDELYDYILELSKTQSVVIPTSTGMQYISMMYEFIKPLCGYGSNIDYLNMGRLSMVELVYCFIKYLTNQHADSDPDLRTIQVSITNLSNMLDQTPLSILNLRANYNIWYNNYRDILLEEDAFEPNDTDIISDDELFVLCVPRQRCWEKDAFTTALDNPGTGNVGVPVGVQSEYDGVPYTAFMQDTTASDSVKDANNVYKVTIGGEEYRVPTSFLSGIDSFSNDQVTLPGFSLYQLDAAQRAQKWLQKALFFGNRISDFYYLRFGVRYLDARLRLPELLTSSSELVKIDVLMNNTTTSESIAGDRAGFASAYDNGNSFDRFCEEHGVIMSYLTIMPQVTYAYGRSRDYSRLDQFDFAFSEFATLGMDAVYDTEITATSIAYAPKVFGYQGKYYDYKAKHSEEHGELLDTQDMYTFARKFNMLDPNGAPKLNYEFVHCFPDLDMFVVDSKLADYFRYDIRHSTAAERGLPSQSIYI